MKFSIRFLLGLTLITALIITAVLQQIAVLRLEHEIQMSDARHTRLQKSIRRLDPTHTQKRIEMCEEVLPDVGIQSETIVAARQRFQQLKNRQGNSDR